MADYTALGAPLYTLEETKTEIKRIDALIEEISADPVSVSVPGTGSASYSGRLKDLRAERQVWLSRYEEALAYEEESRTGKKVSSLQGPSQILE